MKKEAKKLIVLVEDEPTLANLIESGLQRQGYEVQCAQDGKRGLELIRKAKPDLVLLDIMLPGLKGFDVLQKLHDEDHIVPDLPVIVISNSGDSIEVERALKMGVRDYLIKVNFNPNEVIEKVKSVFEQERSKGRKSKKTPLKKVAGKRVLLVEDDTILSDTLERKFLEKKYAVLKAINASMARKALAAGGVDIILLDLVLPDEHGLSFLKELQGDEKFRQIPVIIVSNLGQQKEIDEGLRAGAVDYIVKTNTVPGEIFEKVEYILEKGK